MPYTDIILEIDDGLAIVTLNKPDSLNSFSGQMKKELLDVFTKISNGTIEARALLITGAGRAFCAGADLSETEPGSDLEVLLNETYHPFLETLRALDIPVVTAVNGVAAGAGLSFALHGDIIVSSEKASFLMAFVRIGLSPDAGATFLMPRLIGEARTRRMVMLGEQIDAKTAHEWGMTTHLVSEEELMTTAKDIAMKLAKGPTKALSGMRKLMAATSDNSYSEQLALEAKVQGTLGRSEDVVEGISAFIEKRPAVFKGA